MTKSIILSKYLDETTGKQIKITIDKYEEYLKKKDKENIAKFIYHRLHGRYLKPFDFDDKDYEKYFKNVFAIMANCCLLIETLESFKNGWGDSNNKSRKAFTQFFKNDKNFSELKDKGNEFYESIRCGILHQGETTNGYVLNKKGVALFDTASKSINAYIFSKKMEKSLEDYKNILIKSEWDSEVWDNFRTKMRKIIENCKS